MGGLRKGWHEVSKGAELNSLSCFNAKIFASKRK